MVEQLFGSKTRVKLLQLFYSSPNRSFFVREITRKIDEQINSVRRELSNLLSIGIVVSENTNNKLYYEVNQKFEYYEPLSIMFGKDAKKPVKTASTSDAAPSEIDIVMSLGNVDLALYTGQFTHDELSGTDLMIVGDVNQTKLAKFVADLEARENKEIRYVVMPLDEYHYRLQVKDRFIADVRAAKKQVLVDKSALLDQPIS